MVNLLLDKTRIGGALVEPQYVYLWRTGNSLLACQRLEVRGVGIEISEKYVEEARRRLSSQNTEPRQPERRNNKTTVFVPDANDIDRIVQERLEAVVLAAEPSKGPGRPNETAKLADIIDTLRKRRCSWQQITDKLNVQFPNKTFNKEQVRKIWERHFGKNRRK